ncbi:MAG: thioredoxin family protein [Solirubrobacteraceae bacterium]
MTRREADPVTVEILYFDGCPNHETLLPHLHDLLRRAGVAETIELRRVEDDDAAQRERFLGSPTVRVNGRDIEPEADARNDFGLKCRLYQTPEGLRGSPLDEWLLDALTQRSA